MKWFLRCIYKSTEGDATSVVISQSDWLDLDEHWAITPTYSFF